jgi:hypothetical protein
MLAIAPLICPARIESQTPTPPDSIVVTRHQIVVAGRALRYTARAGLLPLRDNTTG